MEISFEQLLNLLMARLEGLNAAVEDMRFRMNVIGSLLLEKTGLTLSEVENAVQSQLNVMKEVGSIESISSAQVKSLAKSILHWFQGDVDSIQEEIEAYEKMVKEASASMSPNTKENIIQIASPNLMDDLEKIKRKM
ncbi:MAG TPA: hypothetical protein P5560_01730 [Thermotogota bacterium]|nr:hypothetical protein [Thermotogota bacterium]HRW91648.1 hypothetical protein [Thermotogota bacterium]